jgi:hypothetical protein
MESSKLNKHTCSSVLVESDALEPDWNQAEVQVAACLCLRRGWVDDHRGRALYTRIDSAWLARLLGARILATAGPSLLGLGEATQHLDIQPTATSQLRGVPMMLTIAVASSSK